MPIKSISTQQAGQVLDATHFLNVQGNPVLVYDIEGEVNSTTGTAYYLQIHGVSPTSTVTVPLWSRLVVPASAPSQKNGFSFVYRPIGLNTSTMTYPEGATTGGANTSGIWFAISSTDNVYTSVAASTQLDVDIEDTYQEIANQTIIGDTTTGIDGLVVWADPGGTHDLLQIEVSNTTNATSGVLVVGTLYQIVTFVAGDNFLNVGATANTTGITFVATGTTPTTWSNGSTLKAALYLMLFAAAPGANGQVPLQQWTISDNGFHTFRFNPGLVIQSVGNSLSNLPPTNFTYHTGCYFYGSSTTQFLTATVATAWTMKAWYL
jgi:hypothetical protein